MRGTDIRFELNGVMFIWDEHKAQANRVSHPGVSFEQGAEVFFDPFFRIVDASRNDEARDAVIGRDLLGRLLFVVHIEFEDEAIRIISARRATQEDRETYDS
jgi:uncharacterized DUF497 family protein